MSGQDALERLRESLSEAVTSLRKKKDGIDESEPQRDAAWLALGAVLTYLSAVGLERTLQAPLVHLRAALEDAEFGRLNSMTEPTIRPPSFPRKNTMEVVPRTLAAAAWKVIAPRHSGEKSAKALREAARAAGVTSEELKAYQYNLRRGRAWRGASELYSRALSGARPGEQPSEYAKRLLESVRLLRLRS